MVCRKESGFGGGGRSGGGVLGGGRGVNTKSESQRIEKERKVCLISVNEEFVDGK